MIGLILILFVLAIGSSLVYKVLGFAVGLFFSVVVLGLLVLALLYAFVQSKFGGDRMGEIDESAQDHQESPVHALGAC